MAVSSSSSGHEGKRSRLSAILHLRCPRCREGRVFRGLFASNSRCPQCNLKFEREQGYFVGAMYISYGLAVLLISLFGTAVYMVAPGLEFHWIVLVAWVLFLPAAVPVFRYARVMWLHFDRSIDPG